VCYFAFNCSLRSIFHHSCNYRSVVLFGHGEIIEEREEKLKAMRVLSDNILKNRWDEVREPNDTEIKSTMYSNSPRTGNLILFDSLGLSR